MYAYAAAYSDDGIVRLPFDDVGAVVPEVWERWLALDPVVMAGEPRHAEALRSMRAIWVDAGSRDEYHLDFAAVAFRRALEAAGVPGSGCTSSCSRPATGASNTATRSPSPGSPTASRSSRGVVSRP
ncbi:hypothetical protein ACFQ0B_00585 [Nonomuraea thailandensis]